MLSRRGLRRFLPTLHLHTSPSAQVREAKQRLEKQKAETIVKIQEVEGTIRSLEQAVMAKQVKYSYFENFRTCESFHSIAFHFSPFQFIVFHLNPFQSIAGPSSDLSDKDSTEEAEARG